MAGSVTLLSLAIGSFAAYALGRFKFHGRSFVLYLMLSMTIFPQIAILGALYTTITKFNLYDKLGALSFSNLIFTLPFTVWVLTSFMRSLPGDLEEAAYVDGATPVAGLLQSAAAVDRTGPRHDRPACVHRRVERVPVSALVHPVAEQVHGAARDHVLRSVSRRILRRASDPASAHAVRVATSSREQRERCEHAVEIARVMRGTAAASRPTVGATATRIPRESATPAANASRRARRTS